MASIKKNLCETCITYKCKASRQTRESGFKKCLMFKPDDTNICEFLAGSECLNEKAHKTAKKGNLDNYFD